jgi:hypothetical protein
MQKKTSNKSLKPVIFLISVIFVLLLLAGLGFLYLMGGIWGGMMNHI